ncbi:sensor histidine kinase [Micromonospora sp. CPCC 206061]|uniref:sensor histidine kinase n=1 Tax=Micromonospora sp. CPCC 206061 TaxID=3122410 RepID=UPI002FEFD22C
MARCRRAFSVVVALAVLVAATVDTEPLMFVLGLAAGGVAVAGWPAERARTGTADGAGLLLRTVCHELGTPVRSLQSLTRALAEEADTDRQAVARLAQEQAGHLASVLSQATEVAQGLHGSPLADEPVPIGRLLPAVAAVVPPRRLRLRVDERVLARPVAGRRTRQVLINLLDNAVRHGPPEGPVVLRLEAVAGGVAVLVQDEGLDSSPVEAALRRPTPPAGTSGMGLWIVRQLVAVDGGTVTVCRTRTGVAIRVLLPCPSRRRPAA